MDDTLERVVWQSFDYPTDTFIPEMKFGKNLVTGKEWSLSSWKSNQDPAHGEFSWSLDTSAYPQSLLKQGEVIKFRRPWVAEQFNRDSPLSRNLNFTYNNEMVVAYSSNLDNCSVLWRFTLNSSGVEERSVWIENDKKWQTLLTLPTDICDSYNMCNAYATCTMTSQGCACLDEKRFVPRNEEGWKKEDWSGGCVRRTPLDCKNGTDGFIKYSNVKLPDAKSSWFNRSMTMKECEEECLRNCSCMAYANTDIRFEGLGCLVWFSDLLDIRDVSKITGGQNIFVRMASSELEYIMGVILPGRPIANVYMSMTQAISFLSDFKLGHYMKIPPKSMFLVQFVGTIVAGTINVVVAIWMLDSIDNICQDDLPPADSPWTCPGDRVFFDASVIWGLVGPKRIFGSLGNYGSMNWFFLGGALGPIIIWLFYKAFPQQTWLPLINLPVILGATGAMPPATAVNYNSWIIVGTVFNYFVFRYRKKWWQRYNYILSAALDAGVAFMAVLLYFSVGIEDKEVSWWGTGGEHCPLATCPTAKGITASGCPLNN